MNSQNILSNKKLTVISFRVFILCNLIFILSCNKEKEHTDLSYPRVVIVSITETNANNTTFHGAFLHPGHGEIIDHGFVFGTNSSLFIDHDESVSLGASSGSGSFSATVSNEQLQYAVNVSAYARNKDKIYYSEPVNFVKLKPQ